jgi:hypothetical protein
LLALALLLFSTAAHADLYRWVDPETGSVKLSSTPPPWFERSAGPKVEVIPYSAPGAKPAAADPAGSPMARWRELLLSVSSQPSREGLQQLINLMNELDRVDPLGANRRRSELTALAQKLQK